MPSARYVRESDAPNPERIVKEFDRLYAASQPAFEVMQEIADYIVPNKAVVTKQVVPGAELTERLWHSVGVHANNLLAASMAGALTSAAVRWFSLKFRNQRLNEYPAGMRWLQECEERIYLALRQSNFNAESGEMYIDMGLGTGALFMKERSKQVPGFNGLFFKGVPPGSYVIAENAEGDVNRLTRRLRWTGWQITEQFPRATLPDDIKEVITNKPETTHDVLHAVYPRTNTNPKRRDALHMPFASCYVLKKTKTLLDEGGEQEFPYAVPRWAVTTGEVWGRGPGHTALPDMRTLNGIVEKTLNAASKAIDPPGLVNSDATIAELDMRSGSQNVVDGDPDHAWRALESGSNVQLGELKLAEYREAIRQMFFWDQLNLPGDRAMTLGEVERRLELMRRVLGPTLGRFEHEFLNMLLNRVYNLMLRARALPPPPREIAGANLDVEYEGPLARSQKMARVAGFEQFMTLLTPLQPFPALYEHAMENVNLDEAVRDLLDITTGVSSYKVDIEERDARRAQKAQAQAQQAQLEQMATGAEAAGKAAPMLKELAGSAGGNGRGA